MKALIKEAISLLAKPGVSLVDGWLTSDAVKKISALIDDKFSDHCTNSRLAFMFTVCDQASRLGIQLDHRPQAVALQNEDAVEHLTNAVNAWWLGMPRMYRFIFPMPELTARLGSDGPIVLCEGVVFRIEEIPASSDVLAPPRYSRLNAMLEAGNHERSFGLSVDVQGILAYAGHEEPAAVSATRICKVVILLADVLGLLEEPSMPSVRDVKRTMCVDIANGTLETMAPPEGMERTLSRIRLDSANLKSEFIYGDKEETWRSVFARNLAPIGEVIAAARDHACDKPKANETAKERSRRLANVHAERIMTAATWLFDAARDFSPPRQYMQVAIGLEALYGGEEDDAVRATLSNRIAYALGKGPGERSDLARQFGEFYSGRSKIVHSGLSRLNKEDRSSLAWGFRTLRAALRHETLLLITSSRRRGEGG